MDGVLLNLKSNMPNIMRSNPHRTTSPRTTTSPIAHPVRSRSPRTVSPVTTPSTRNPENIQPSYGNITKLAPIDPECSNVSVVVVVSPPPHSPPFPRPDGSAAAPRSSVRPRTPSRSCSPQQACPQGDAEFLPLREAQSLDSVCSRRSTTSITTTATVSPKKKSPSRSAQHKEECGNNGFVSLDVMKTLISTTHLHNGGGGKVVTGRSRSSSARKDRCPDVFDLPATHHRDDHLHRPVHHHVSLDVLRGKHKPQDARGR
ncbi:Hypothetical protein, putative [Bodo saltans]|uniref:Uncharacterized protein n=1 Tax=Bodo saltans TaxID=75058 RepID=A0A0S4J408_BODSA|nr:Hypothetical protein, putative [Bodo saltans]|eukprot:CUG76081.1 Hypothetical protein, putative [Bodo saltans]